MMRINQRNAREMKLSGSNIASCIPILSWLSIRKSWGVIVILLAQYGNFFYKGLNNGPSLRDGPVYLSPSGDFFAGSGDNKMECERLNRLVRSWYVQVQDEALAPARMVEFMEKHVKSCEACLSDPDVRAEVKKITEIVLPPSKMIKAVKEDEEGEGEESSSMYEAGEEEADVGEDTDEDEDDFIPSVMDEEDEDI